MKQIKLIASQAYYECPKWLYEDRTIDQIIISGECTEAEVDVLLYSIIGSSDIKLTDDPKKTLMDLCIELKKAETIIEGGLMFIEDGKVITPSCCAGLEQWKEVVQDINEKAEPWMGHDPFGTCIYEGDKIIVCSDDPTMSKVNEEEIVKIIFSEEEIRGLFDKLEKDMRAFAEGPLRKRINELAPSITEEFIKGWYKNYNEILPG